MGHENFLDCVLNNSQASHAANNAQHSDLPSGEERSNKKRENSDAKCPSRSFNDLRHCRHGKLAET
jgi:hypothetical protein